MRSLQIFIIIGCALLGLYLLGGPGFFMPGRGDPSQGVMLAGTSARLLGTGLLLIAGLGVVALRSFGGGLREHRPYAWHLRYFGALALAVGLIVAAFATGERAPTPGWQARPAR